MNRFLLVLCLAASACATPQKTAGAGSSVGHPLRLVAADERGGSVDLSAKTGNVMLVDLWATWCEPCKESLPYFEKLQQDYRAKGLAVYAVSMDEDQKLVAPFLKRLGVGLPLLWNKSGEETANLLGVARLPTTFLVDKKGIIRFVHEGYDATISADERKQIEALLSE